MVVLRCKVGMIGDATVGKTALLQMVFSNNVQFPKNYTMTMGAELAVKEVHVDQHTTVELYIIDLGGQEVYAKNASDYLTNLDSFIAVYDISNKLTFEGLPKWIDRVRAANTRNMTGVIVGNKIDLKDKAEVADHQGESLARKYNSKYVQTSAMRGVGCMDPLVAVAEDFARRYEDRARMLATLH